MFGGKRHLELAAALIRGAVRPWPSPFDEAVGEVSSIAAVRSACSPRAIRPSMASARCWRGMSIQTRCWCCRGRLRSASRRLGSAGRCRRPTLLSLHGRALDLIRPHLHPGARIMALTPDGEGPQAVAALLNDSGFGASKLTVLEALGGPRERIRSVRAADFSLHRCRSRSMSLRWRLKRRPARGCIARASGLADALFEHDGQITKREIRAMTLSSLAPRRRELLWDIGAGTGSVAIEWMLADPSLRALAVEAKADRAARIRRNAAAFGVPSLEVVEGRAPDALAGLPQPARSLSAVARNSGVLDAAIAALRSGGRLVVNAVTLKTETLLVPRHAALGGELVRIALSRADTVGGMTGWRPALPMTQWVWTKP